ncbi:MAG TPA: YggS family pyridoxal phosphate-dependent enzyme [Thermoanaerobaculia bacterium]|nr:YggS family pyridoxal phosphate-dependent enzyme [Thermoanaerobaculia bacterium]
MSIAENLAAVEARMCAACDRAGRTRRDVTLVAVSKTFPAEFVDEAIAAGVTHVGENRVQEARDKKPMVRGSARWHLIGHLQSNKAKDAVRIFDVIETVDSVDLAQKIARASDTARDVLLQVNIGDEPQKSGVAPADVESMVRQIRTIEGVRLIGLMAIPPIGDSRPHFRRLRELRDRVGLEHLSMGMSEDFETAIEEGSTMVRIGRAIFGPRG